MLGDREGSLGRLLTPSEVAQKFRVDPKTVTRWAAAGKITSVKTPGGHRRFWEAEVEELIQEDVRDVDALEGFARWVAALDDPNPLSVGYRTRQRVTLNEIIAKAHEALAGTGEE